MKTSKTKVQMTLKCETIYIFVFRSIIPAKIELFKIWLK